MVNRLIHILSKKLLSLKILNLLMIAILFLKICYYFSIYDNSCKN